MAKTPLPDLHAQIEGQIFVLRGQRVMLDSALAELYCVEVKVLNQAVRRNLDHFPEDFMLRLTPAEAQSLRSQFVTLETGRGKYTKYLLDTDLAKLYGVATKRLNERVKRNAARFPDDFLFRLAQEEADALNRSHFATGSGKHRDPRFPPYAFTEHGALMAATLLNSAHAVQVSIYGVRAFVRLRETLAQNKELAARLAELERKTEALAYKHDAFAGDTRAQLLTREEWQSLKSQIARGEPRRKALRRKGQARGQRSPTVEAAAPRAFPRQVVEGILFAHLSRQLGRAIPVN